MTLLMRDHENVEKGEELMSKLIKMLIEDNRTSDVIKVTEDRTYRQKLYKEYNIV